MQSRWMNIMLMFHVDSTSNCMLFGVSVQNGNVFTKMSTLFSYQEYTAGRQKLYDLDSELHDKKNIVRYQYEWLCTT